MLIQISSRRDTAPADLVDLLLECHARIRRFIAMAHEVGVRHDVPEEETVDACTRVERYFTEALPLHVADEEESVLPRLRGKSADLERAMTMMVEQHARHEPKLQALLLASAAVRMAPSDPESRRPLVEAASDLEREFAEHLTLEETTIFPAIRQFLDEATTTTVVSELRQRRGPSGLLPHEASRAGDPSGATAGNHPK